MLEGFTTLVFTCYMMSAWHWLRDTIVFILVASLGHRKISRGKVYPGFIKICQPWIGCVVYTVCFAGLQREFTVPLSEDLFIRKQAKLEQQVSAQLYTM